MINDDIRKFVTKSELGVTPIESNQRRIRQEGDETQCKWMQPLSSIESEQMTFKEGRTIYCKILMMTETMRKPPNVFTDRLSLSDFLSEEISGIKF